MALYYKTLIKININILVFNAIVNRIIDDDGEGRSVQYFKKIQL